MLIGLTHEDSLFIGLTSTIGPLIPSILDPFYAQRPHYGIGVCPQMWTPGEPAAGNPRAPIETQHPENLEVRRVKQGAENVIYTKNSV